MWSVSDLEQQQTKYSTNQVLALPEWRFLTQGERMPVPQTVSKVLLYHAWTSRCKGENCKPVVLSGLRDRAQVRHFASQVCLTSDSLE